MGPQTPHVQISFYASHPPNCEQAAASPPPCSGSSGAPTTACASALPALRTSSPVPTGIARPRVGPDAARLTSGTPSRTGRLWLGSHVTPTAPSVHLLFLLLGEVFPEGLHAPSRRQPRCVLLTWPFPASQSQLLARGLRPLPAPILF